MVKLFADGGWAMWPLLVLLIIGIAVAIERLITLSRAAIDAEEFFKDLEGALKKWRARSGCSAVFGNARPRSFGYPCRAFADASRH